MLPYVAVFAMNVVFHGSIIIQKKPNFYIIIKIIKKFFAEIVKI